MLSSYTTLHIINAGGNKEDVEDCFQQAMIVLFAAIAEGKFKLSKLSLKTHTDQIGSYLMAICRNQWRSELRWRNRKPLPQDDKEEDTVFADLSVKLAGEVFLTMGKECKQLLSFYFVRRLSPKLIGGHLNKKTETVKNQITACTNSFIEKIGTVLRNERGDGLMEVLQLGLEAVDERCRNIITAFYLERKSMAEIAEKMGYASAHSVTEQKNRCMKRLNEAIVSRVLNNK